MNMLSKKQRIVNRITSMVLGILAGLVMVILGAVLDISTLLWLAMIIWGVVIVLGNARGMIYSLINIKSKGALFDLIMSSIGVLLGVVLIVFNHKVFSTVIALILAAYMIVFPVIRILLAKGHRVEQLKSEALRIILGVLLLVFGSTILAVGEDIVKLLLTIIGWIIIALTTVLGVVEILHVALEKPNYKTGEPIYIEHTEE